MNVPQNNQDIGLSSSDEEIIEEHELPQIINAKNDIIKIIVETPRNTNLDEDKDEFCSSDMYPCHIAMFGSICFAVGLCLLMNHLCPNGC